MTDLAHYITDYGYWALFIGCWLRRNHHAAGRHRRPRRAAALAVGDSRGGARRHAGGSAAVLHRPPVRRPGHLAAQRAGKAHHARQKADRPPPDAVRYRGALYVRLPHHRPGADRRQPAAAVALCAAQHPRRHSLGDDLRHARLFWRRAIESFFTGFNKKLSSLLFVALAIAAILLVRFWWRKRHAE